MRKYLGSGRYQGAGPALTESLEAKLANPPLQERLRYRPGDYNQFRQELLDQITLDPRLARWTYRGSDDPAIALLETASTIGEILALYGDVYASEAFLGTARWAESIQDLVRLSGYRLSPPLAGLAEFAFEFKGSASVTVPANFAVRAQLAGQDLPVTFETSNEMIGYPAFSKFQLYRPSIPSQDKGCWHLLGSCNQRFFFDAPNGVKPPVALSVNDRVFIGVLGDNGQLKDARIQVVDAVDQVLGLTRVTLRGSGYSLSPLQKNVMLYKVKDTYRHFGHDAPPSGSAIDGTTILYSHWRQTDSDTTGNYPERKCQGKAPIVHRPYIAPTLSNCEYPLDREVNDLCAGETFVVEASLHTIQDSWKANFTQVKMGTGTGKSYKLKSGTAFSGTAVKSGEAPPIASAPQTKSVNVTHIRTLSSIRSITMTWGTTNGPCSLLTLNQPLGSGSKKNLSTTAMIGDIRLHRIVGHGMAFRPWLQPSGDSGNQLTFYGSEAEAQALVGRRLLVSGEEYRDQILTVTSLGPWRLYPVSTPTLRQIYIDTTVNYSDYPLEGGTLMANANLVPATQGKTEAETIIGSGDPSQAFQSFRIERKPLTYLVDTKTTPPEVPQLQVRVSNKLWFCVPSFYGQSADAQVYVVREDDDGFSWIQFGDGITGARPDRGNDNISVIYRTGAGAHGAMEPGQQPSAVSKLERLKEIRLAGVVTGGTERESVENARVAAPGKVLGLGRIVSLADVEHELLAIAGVAKVRVTWQNHSDVTALVATVLMETGRDAELEQVRKTIHAYNRSRGSARFPIIMCQGTILPVSIKLRYGLDPSYRRADAVSALQSALGASSETEEARSGLFALDQRHFGQKEYAHTIEAIAAGLNGITWAEVTQLGFASLQDLNSVSNPLLQGSWHGRLLRIPNEWPAQLLRRRSLACPPNSILVLDKANLILESTIGDTP